MALEILEILVEKAGVAFEHAEHVEALDEFRHKGVKNYPSGKKNEEKKRASFKEKMKSLGKAASHSIKQTTAGGVAQNTTEIALAVKTSVIAALHHNVPAFVVGHQFPSAIKACGAIARTAVDVAWNAPKNINSTAKRFKADVKKVGIKGATKHLGQTIGRGSTINMIRAGRFFAQTGKNLANDFMTKPPVGCVVCGAKAAANKFKETMEKPREGKASVVKDGLKIGNAVYKSSAAFLKTAGKVAFDGYTHHGPLKYAVSGIKGIAKTVNNGINNLRNPKPKEASKNVAKVSKPKQEAISGALKNKLNAKMSR